MRTTSPAVEVSVVIPAYGRPAFLRELLRSVFECGFESLEVIIIDDGSPVPIPASVLDEFESAPVRLVRQENAGVAAARNAGAALASGEFIMFVDDDDLVPVDSVSWRLAYLRAHTNHSAVAGRCSFISQGERTDVEAIRWTGALTPWDLLIQNRFYSPGQVLIRRSAFEATDGCRRDCIGSDDWALWIDLARIGPIHCDERIALGYRLHAGNFSKNIATMCGGAERVADGAVATLCEKHAPVADRLATDFVHAAYAPKLVHAALTAREAKNWTALAVITQARARLGLRVVTTRARQKLALVRYHHRWRMPAAEMERLGRNCPDCAGTTHTPPPQWPRIGTTPALA